VVGGDMSVATDPRHATSYSSANDPMDQARQQTGGF